MDLGIIQYFVGGAAALAAMPGTVELSALTLASLMPAPRPVPASGDHGLVRIMIVIPAHNERENIGACLDSLQADGAENICVIADNCTDETAAIALGRGVQVLERFSADKRGKGYALDYAFSQLAPQQFDVYLMVDADSLAPRGFLNAFRQTFAAGADAAQCAYLVSNRDDNARTRLLDVALRGFNLIRPLGRERLGLSAGILGNGFALRRETLEKVPYTAASVVEDLEYHLALIRAGFRVRFVEGTRVYGAMPAAGKGRETQRARWEGGRLRMLLDHGAQLAASALSGNAVSWEPLLDLLLLPLGYHVLLLLLVTAMLPPAGLAGLALVVAHVAAAVARGTTPGADLKALATAPAYVVWKLMKIPSTLIASSPAAAWVRTERAR